MHATDLSTRLNIVSPSGTGQGRGAEQKINVLGVGARTISTALVLVGGFKSDLRDIISTALVLVISASSCIMFYTFITIASGMQGVLVSTPPFYIYHTPIYQVL